MNPPGSVGFNTGMFRRRVWAAGGLVLLGVLSTAASAVVAALFVPYEAGAGSLLMSQPDLLEGWSGWWRHEYRGVGVRRESTSRILTAPNGASEAMGEPSKAWHRRVGRREVDFRRGFGDSGERVDQSLRMRLWIDESAGFPLPALEHTLVTNFTSVGLVIERVEWGVGLPRAVARNPSALRPYRRPPPRHLAAVPLRPLWWALAFDVACWTGVWWVALVVPSRIRRRWRRWRGLCPRCGYDIKGESTVCPECGVHAAWRATGAGGSR